MSYIAKVSGGGATVQVPERTLSDLIKTDQESGHAVADIS